MRQALDRPIAQTPAKHFIGTLGTAAKPGKICNDKTCAIYHTASPPAYGWASGGLGASTGQAKMRCASGIMYNDGVDGASGERLAPLP